MFSELALDHVRNPRGRGPLAEATHLGQDGSPGGGPYVQLWLRVEKEAIVEASYECNGCPAAVAASSLLAQMLRGRTFEQARRIEPGDLLTILGGLPEGKEPYATRAVNALRHALDPSGNEET